MKNDATAVGCGAPNPTVAATTATRPPLRHTQPPQPNMTHMHSAHTHSGGAARTCVHRVGALGGDDRTDVPHRTAGAVLVRDPLPDEQRALALVSQPNQPVPMRHTNVGDTRRQAAAGTRRRREKHATHHFYCRRHSSRLILTAAADGVGTCGDSTGGVSGDDGYRGARGAQPAAGSHAVAPDADRAPRRGSARRG